MGLVGGIKDIGVAERRFLGCVEKFRVLGPGKIGAALGVDGSEREKEIPREGCHV